MNQLEIRKELARRELARRSLEHFTKYTKPDYEMIAEQGGRPIHKQIIDKLEAVERGEIKRLMIFCPPRLGKSELVSKRFPAWCLGRHPDWNVVVSSYGYDLASDFGRKTKRIAEEGKFKNIFPDFSLAKDKKEGGNWETTIDGGYYSVGVGGALTGKGFDIGIIDDPVKNREEAESATIQARNIDWYSSTFYTRKKSENSAIVVMCTRWNPNDLPGYLLQEQASGADTWDILVIQGIDPEGNEIIWEGKWSKGYFQNERLNMTAKDFAALIQQDPIASSSNIFQMKDIRYYLMSDFERADSILKKEDLRCRIYVDPAFSTSSSSDDIAIMGLGKHKITGNYYELDGYAETSAPSVAFNVILAMYDHLKIDGFKIEEICIEESHLSRDQKQFIDNFKAFIKEKGLYIMVRGINNRVNKEQRIKNILEPKVAMNAIYLRKDMNDPSFNRKLEKQMQEFPNGKHDDALDVLAMGVDDIDKTRALEQPKQERAFFNPLSGKIEVTGRNQDRTKMFGL